MSAEPDTLKQIAEDILLHAALVRTGDAEAEGYFRTTEVVVNLAERLIDVAGIAHEDVWVPTVIRDMLDPDYSDRREAA